MPLPRAILFDLDGTLVDSAATMTAILNVMRARRGMQEIDIDCVRPWVSIGASAIVTKALGEAVADIVVDVAEFRRIYREMKPDPSELFPYVPEALGILRQRDIALGICTNKPEALARHVIDGVGLSPYAQVVVGGRDGLPAKPDPAPLLEALARLGVLAADSIYVGDSTIDAEAAKAAGMPFILVSLGHSADNPNAIACAARIDDFRHLPALVDGLHHRSV